MLFKNYKLLITLTGMSDLSESALPVMEMSSLLIGSHTWWLMKSSGSNTKQRGSLPEVPQAKLSSTSLWKILIIPEEQLRLAASKSPSTDLSGVGAHSFASYFCLHSLCLLL